MQRKKIQKSVIAREVGGSHTEFFFGKSSQNSSKPVLIFWSSILLVFCLYRAYRPTLLKVVSYYDLSVLSMSVMGFQKKFGWGVGDTQIK